jgi:hypothetical protein
MLLQRDLPRQARLRNARESPQRSRFGFNCSARIIRYWNSPKTITPVGVPMNTFPLAIMGVMYLLSEKLSRSPA